MIYLSSFFTLLFWEWLHKCGNTVKGTFLSAHMQALSVKVQWMLFKMTYLYLSGNNDHGRMVLNQTFTIGNAIFSFQAANYKVDLVKLN